MPLEASLIKIKRVAKLDHSLLILYILKVCVKVFFKRVYTDTINHFARQVIPFFNYFVCEKVLSYFGFRWTVTKVIKFFVITSRYVIIVSKKIFVVDIVKFI